MPQDHRNRKDDTRDGKLVQFDALVAMLKRRPPMRSIEDDRYQFWWREAEALLVEIEG